MAERQEWGYRTGECPVCNGWVGLDKHGRVQKHDRGALNHRRPCRGAGREQVKLPWTKGERGWK